jgi:hypothetical protein
LFKTKKSAMMRSALRCVTFWIFQHRITPEWKGFFMTITLNLPPQVEQAYLAAAQARGLPVEEILQETLVAAQPAGAAELSPDEWVREFRAWAHSHDADNLPILSDEAISRDSMYD